MTLTAESLAQAIKQKHQSELATIHGHEVQHEIPPSEDILIGDRLGKELSGRSNILENGLDATQADVNRARFGSNEIELPPQPSYLSLVWEGLEDPTLRILLLSAMVSLALGFSRPKGHSGIEGVSVLLTVVVVVNVQAATNYNKSKEFRKQQEELESRKSVTIIRDKQIMTVHPKVLVVGDVVRAKVGTVIPADGVLMSGELWMDESALTGESRLIHKPVNSIAVSGTNVMKGEGLVIIAAVGKHSISGKILNAIVQEHNEGLEGTSVLFRKLDRLAMDIGRVGMACALFVFLTLLFTWMFACDRSAPDPSMCRTTATWQDTLSIVLEFFITSVTVLVVAVPEGLPLAVTLALAVALGRMLTDRNQVKRFESCETMGSATTICSDKTGTLTENRMKVMRQSPLPKANGETVHDLMVKCFALAVSADSRIIPKSSGSQDPAQQEFIYEGNPTECALLRYCKTVLNTDYEMIQMKYQDGESGGLRWGSYLNPFSSERKMMSLVIKNPESSKNGHARYTMLAKGATTVLLQKCKTCFDDTNGKVVSLTDDLKAKIMDELSQEEELARRVLGFAVRLDLKTKMAKEEDLTFLGWVSLEDPLRQNIPQSVQACKRAGVIVRMITGDSLPTGRAIGRQCGILNPEEELHPDAAMTGAEFDERIHRKDFSAPKVLRRYYDANKDQDSVQLAPPFLLNTAGKKIMDEDEFDRIWPHLRVLARCEPEDKLALVKGLRMSKLYMTNASVPPQVVAVTGDGTNDAPSLKAADIGFAMGIAGTDVAKQAADVIVLDDSFNSIVRALVWGRNVHDSVCKFLQFQMTVNLSAVIFTSIGSLFFMKSPMTSTQMLWVNMIMDSLGSLALATMNPDEERLLSRPPIPKNAPVISLRMAVNIVGQSVLQLSYMMYFLFSTGSEQGHDATPRNKHFYTMVFNIFVMFQFFNELNCKSVSGGYRERFRMSDWKFSSVWIASFLMQILIIQNLGIIFACVPLSLEDWLHCISVGMTCIPWQLAVVDPVAGLVERHLRIGQVILLAAEGEMEDEEAFVEEELGDIEIAAPTEGTPLLASRPTSRFSQESYSATSNRSLPTTAEVSSSADDKNHDATGSSMPPIPQPPHRAGRRWALVRNTVKFANALQESSNHRRRTEMAVGEGVGGGAMVAAMGSPGGKRVPVVKRLIHSISNRSLRSISSVDT